ncbi:MAG: hypothetical protein JSS66_12435 [Armatimonadetes bacterium]|nr:hypothetical protein [Armatimonadota bacterium]
MSFGVQLGSDLLRADPGSSVPVSLEIVNRSDAEDRFEIEIEGLDPAWSAIPVPSFIVEPGETKSERFFLKPPKDSGSLAGVYPFVVNVRSIESGETRTAQAALEIRSYQNFSLDVQPKKGTISPFSSSTQFRITLMNLGNSEQTMQMGAADTEGLFAFEFDADQVTLAAGQQRDLTLTVAGSKRSLLANSRLQNFTVTARSTENPAVAATGNAQVEQKALASPGTFVLLLAIVGLLAAWILMWPKPPRILSLMLVNATGQHQTAGTTETTVGLPVEVRWRTSRATSVRVQIGNWVEDSQLPEGSLSFTPDKEGDFLVEVTAFNGDQKARDDSNTIRVAAKPAVPKPEISELNVEEKQLNLGQTYMLHYRFSPTVTRATLLPMQKELDIKEQEILLTADTVGKTKLTVKAFNSAGDSIESSVTVNVIKISKAKVVDFSADPLEVDPGGMVNLGFTVTGAVKLKIVYEGGHEVDIDPAKEVTVIGDQWKGNKLLEVKTDTTFKLMAYDAEGIAATAASVKVRVKKTDSSGEPDPTTGGNGGGH